ncbi:MAG: hypothetical protein L3J20_05345 [Flavobacteriaceae bacterium]|nr:hypothetical protein [Flavobacteriaceae bacterium]
MSFIKTISYKEATNSLKRLYDKVKGPNNNIDNIMQIHSLRPHTMTGHMSLYKNVLHHSNNTMPKWFLETIGVYVSILNNCSYCVDHHFNPYYSWVFVMKSQNTNLIGKRRHFLLKKLLPNFEGNKF